MVTLGNAYSLVEKQGWIVEENMIMQPERTANVDALVVLAINVFLKTIVKLTTMLLPLALKRVSIITKPF